MSDDLISRAAALAALDQHAHGTTILGGQRYRSITLEVAVEAIRALPAVAASQQVRVKPLVWEDLGGHYENRFAKADAPLFGSIRCESYLKRQFTVSWSVPGFSSLFMECVFPTLEAAKSAAQANYEQRILAAIETQPDPRDTVIAQLVEAARSGLNSLQNTENEIGIILGSADKLRAALVAAKKGLKNE